MIDFNLRTESLLDWIRLTYGEGWNLFFLLNLFPSIVHHRIIIFTTNLYPLQKIWLRKHHLHDHLLQKMLSRVFPWFCRLFLLHQSKYFLLCNRAKDDNQKRYEIFSSLSETRSQYLNPSNWFSIISLSILALVLAKKTSFLLPIKVEQPLIKIISSLPTMPISTSLSSSLSNSCCNPSWWHYLRYLSSYFVCKRQCKGITNC